MICREGSIFSRHWHNHPFVFPLLILFTVSLCDCSQVPMLCCEGNTPLRMAKYKGHLQMSETCSSEGQDCSKGIVSCSIVSRGGKVWFYVCLSLSNFGHSYTAVYKGTAQGTNVHYSDVLIEIWVLSINSLKGVSSLVKNVWWPND